MAKGYLQKYKIDFKKTYATIIKTIISHIFITLTAYFGWVIKQINIITAFFNTNLDFIIYFKLLKGYFPKGKIIKTLKTLYNLK